MTSGIYQLTFSDGSTYVGQSINIEARLDQHLEKLAKGKGARPLQECFNRCGLKFSAKTLFKCHSDHLDIMEAYYIDTIHPNLNTIFPSNRLRSMSEADRDSIIQWLDISTLEHLSLLNSQYTLVSQYRELEQILTNKCDQLSERRSKEEIAFDTSKRVLQLEQRLALKQDDIEILKEEVDHANRLIAYYKLPWWKKLLS